MNNKESISTFTFKCPTKSKPAKEAVTVEATYNHSTGLLELKPKCLDYSGPMPLARTDEAKAFCEEHEGNYFYMRDVMLALGGAGVDTYSIKEGELIKEAVEILQTKTPPVEWDRYLMGMEELYRAEVARRLQYNAIEAMRLAAYANARDKGDTHSTAVGASNVAAASAAKSLGFSYPKSFDLNF